MTGRVRTIILLLAVVSLFTGCVWRYSFKPGNIPPQIKSVYIDDTVNRTSEFRLGELFTAQLTEKMQLENLLPLSDENAANSIIYTGITRVSDAVATYDESEVVKEYRLTMSMDFRWYDAVNGKDMMDSKLSDYELYYSDQYNNSLSSTDRITREDALENLLDKMTENVLTKLTSQW